MLLLLATLLALIASGSNVANAFVTQMHTGGRATRRAQALQPRMSASSTPPPKPQSALLFLVDDDKAWNVRRKLSREVLLPVLNSVTSKLKNNGTSTDDALLTSRTREEAMAAKIERREKEARIGVITTAFFVAVGAAVLRLGGRGALLNLLGLDFIQGADVGSQIQSFVIGFQSMGNLGTLGFFGGWLLAKFLCLDFIGVSLALSSGVLYGGVLEGTLVSVAASVAASVIVFSVSRYFLKDQIRPEIEKRSILRAVDGAVSKDGLKTVFVLRLSPILPIPLGAYNYLYGVTSLRLSDFIAGISLASFKPYFLDSYLGVFGKSVLDKSDDNGATDALLLIVLGAIIAVGTLATQVAGTLYDEIKTEAKKMDEDKLSSQVSPIVGIDASSSNSTLAAYVFGLMDGGTNLPSWATNIRNSWTNATEKLGVVIDDELCSVIEEKKGGLYWTWDGLLEEGNATALAIPLRLKERGINKQQQLTEAFASSEKYAYPGVRELQPYEKEDDEISWQSLIESSVFSFVLLSKIFSLLDEETFVEEV